jgi:hypothetical protein
MTRATSQEHVGRAVKVTRSNGLVTVGVLVGVPLDGSVIFREFVSDPLVSRAVKTETTQVQPALLENLEILSWTCSVCHRDSIAVHSESKICTDCVRRLAAKAAAGERSRCEKCGSGHAFRNPKYDQYYCVTCHREAGTLPTEELDDGSTAECAGKPATDPRHSWKFVRGARRACRNCYVHDYVGSRP